MNLRGDQQTVISTARLWKAWENYKTVFPALPTALGNRYRDSQIPTESQTPTHSVLSPPQPTVLQEVLTGQYNAFQA